MGGAACDSIFPNGVNGPTLRSRNRVGGKRMVRRQKQISARSPETH